MSEPEPSEPEPVVVGELWETARRPEEGFHSVAVWPGAGDRAWLLATAGSTHRLVIFDAATGELLRELGAAGDGPAEFEDPGAITVVDDLALVAERGNSRVQVLRLPGLAPLGFFAEGELERPLGIGASRLPGGGYEVLVAEGEDLQAGSTDADAEAVEAPLDRSRRYRVALRDGHLDAGAGEAVEAPAGQVPGSLAAVYACPGGGYRIVAEGGGAGLTRFHLVDRATGEPVATFTGRLTAGTTGIWLSQVPLPDLPAGALYAVHDGASVTAFDWRDVAAATGVRADCVLEGK